jgi:flagellar protein FlaI
MNIVISGETASGKTTLLNALATFIKPDAKVYSVEDTPELNIPHKIWQRLVTREVGKSADVSMYDLLKAALRSRPNYILIGEIRGKEGYVAFQAMQTGHPVMTTFHSGNIVSLIERLTGEPINIPITFIDNLNIAVFTTSVTVKGRYERRVTNIYEIEKYIAELKKVAVRNVFTWNSVQDKHMFIGKYNSYILEKKIAPLMKIDDKRKIYQILDYRAKILKKMVENEIFDFFEVWEILKNFYINGPSALPFSV